MSDYMQTNDTQVSKINLAQLTIFISIEKNGKTCWISCGPGLNLCISNKKIGFKK